ncbi:hypothetical protein XCR_0297 [Xanthomonas campestris pv. raphani 756C]|nr:hypothetical protein XCR_0297 [Xanthomonas campestris pv. raphani 756C]
MRSRGREQRLINRIAAGTRAAALGQKVLTRRLRRYSLVFGTSRSPRSRSHVEFVHARTRNAQLWRVLHQSVIHGSQDAHAPPAEPRNM